MQLPSGTVTLLFSDMEGSTRLLARLGSAYATALDLQRRLLREAWAQHGGIELGTEGDSFMVVFDNAPAAVTAAVAAQRRLAEADWPSGERVAVRIGIHTGAPMRHRDGYVGMDVHRAARVASVAHGGQVLVTDATARLVKSTEVGFKDLGAHTLKDLPLPEHLFQVTGQGLAREFPAVRSLGSASSLPVPATPLVGRDVELARLVGLLEEDDIRLVTLTGPGGCGKTRLALAAAADVAASNGDGIFFVPLEAVTSGEVMWTSIATALGVPPEGRILPGLLDHLAGRTGLLVLDNLEQLPDASDVVWQLQGAAPSLRVLATSRHALHVPGEQEHPVAPLALPDEVDLATVAASAAVQLFVRQAQRVRPAFRLTTDNAAAVAQICSQLDGLPLALELAAARLRLLSPQALLTRLDQALNLGGQATGRAARQQSLRQAIQWSYDLLAPDEQRLFRGLAVFAGTADLEAVEVVARAVGLEGADVEGLLESLLAASLVTAAETGEGEPRIGMLRTIRTFALERLREDEAEEAVRWAAASYLAVLADPSDRPLEAEARGRHRARLQLEHDNFRQAMDWLQDRGGAHRADQDPLTLHLRIVGSLAHAVYAALGYYDEGRRRCERVLELAEDKRGPLVGWCQLGLTALYLHGFDVEAAAEMVQRARRSLAEPDPEGWVTADRLERLWEDALLASAQVELGRGDLDAAQREYQQVVDRSSGSRAMVSGLLGLAVLEAMRDQPEAAYELESRAVTASRRLGDLDSLLRAQHNAAVSLRELGRAEEAREQMVALLPRLLTQRDPEAIVTGAEDYTAVLSDLGEYPAAAVLFGAAEALRKRVGIPRPPVQTAELEESLARAQSSLGERWDELVDRGRGMSVEDALGLAAVPAARPDGEGGSAR
ncbi:MAG: hypothetical protein AVDCRST_MAG34-645 [uncultured Nocardioidaceae bacterium]|uniref:Guanylate cyclase domain-containing protein n=1 Tax=uncultured Nocardioidaceae bacterium TaxID=253824 RepID=A0A6J4LQ23_9ACTN|nr:MAG: hypothetical protein AVDCRST_MAG34-645 [uncultured Nocardioidaceae bacterium]